jgi:hypothetical protein
MSLYASESLILATDAVSKWVLGGEDALRDERLQFLQAQTPERWPAFVETFRGMNRIEDDDSTIMLFDLIDSDDPHSGLDAIRKRTKVRRYKEFNDALASEDEVQIALAYGSGEYFAEKFQSVAGKTTLARCRAVAKALREAIAALKNAGDPHSIWARHEDLLSNAACAADIRDTFRQLGVIDVAHERSRKYGRLQAAIAKSDAKAAALAWQQCLEIMTSDDFAPDVISSLIALGFNPGTTFTDSNPTKGTEVEPHSASSSDENQRSDEADVSTPIRDAKNVVLSSTNDPVTSTTSQSLPENGAHEEQSVDSDM